MSGTAGCEANQDGRNSGGSFPKTSNMKTAAEMVGLK
jgi:hypothetical protein